LWVRLQRFKIFLRVQVAAICCYTQRLKYCNRSVITRQIKKIDVMKINNVKSSLNRHIQINPDKTVHYVIVRKGKNNIEFH